MPITTNHKGVNIMVNTNTKTTNVINVNQPNQLPSNLGIAGSVAWAKSKGLSSFSQLVIGKGTCPNYKLANTSAGKRKTVLLNNAMVGQTVAQYYTKAKGVVSGSISTNNPLQAIKHGLITLQLPNK